MAAIPSPPLFFDPASYARSVRIASATSSTFLASGLVPDRPFGRQLIDHYRNPLMTAALREHLDDLVPAC